MSSHQYPPYDSHRSPPPSSRPRAPSYSGLPPPPPHHQHPHHHHEHVVVVPKHRGAVDPRHHHHSSQSATPTSGSPGDYNTYSPTTSSYGRTTATITTAPSISTSSLSSSSYAGSAEDESMASRGVDMVDMLTQRLAGAFDPLQLDRSLAMQAQTSGMLNSKTRELIALQEEAQARLAETRRNFVEGMKIAKEVKADLDYVHRKVRVLKQKTERKYPVEYNMARDRIPPPS